MAKKGRKRLVAKAIALLDAHVRKGDQGQNSLDLAYKQ